MKGPYKYELAHVRGYPLIEELAPKFQPGRYRIVAGFNDGEGTHHEAGEEWLLVFACFVPYDNTMFLGVSLNNDWQWIIPLVWDKNYQESVIENFASYAMRIGPLPDGFEFKIEPFY